MNISFFIFELIVFIFSVIIHEISHGYIAERLGDPTARLAGRLTLNPISHIDPFGSIILPLILAIPVLFGAPAIIFGWAKPVPYNPLNLKDPKRGAGLIAIAGPISNLLLASVFGVIIRLMPNATTSPLGLLFAVIVYVNILLAVFNLIPIPPLDGSKVLFSILPDTEGSYRLATFLERYGYIILLAFIFFGFGLIIPIIQSLFALITGHFFGM